MNEIKVLLYGSGLPVAGQVVHCVVGQNALQLRPHEGEDLRVIQFAGLRAGVAGFEHDRLLLSWKHDDSSDWSLIPADAGEQKKLIAALPQHVIPGMAQWQRATRSQSRVWQGIVYTLGLVALAFVLLVWQHERVAMWAANRVSMKTEKKLGEQVLKSLNPEANFLQEGEAVNTVKEIGNRLTAGSRYPYQWYVSKDPAVNAFAIPGGFVVVNSGLLKKVDSADELAAVLAHEVQHVEQRHALQNMMNSAAVASVVLVVLGDANAVAMLLAHQVSTQYFNRQIESDADIKGVQMLQEKNLDAKGMVSFFKKMDAGFDVKNEGEKPSEVAGWFSSHPDTLIRIQVIEEYLAQHPCATCAPLVWDRAAMLAGLEAAEKK